jgi:hypothetical protein
LGEEASSLAGFGALFLRQFLRYVLKVELSLAFVFFKIAVASRAQLPHLI